MAGIGCSRRNPRYQRRQPLPRVMARGDILPDSRADYLVGIDLEVRDFELEDPFLTCARRPGEVLDGGDPTSMPPRSKMPLWHVMPSWSGRGGTGDWKPLCRCLAERRAWFSDASRYGILLIIVSSQTGTESAFRLCAVCFSFHLHLAQQLPQVSALWKIAAAVLPGATHPLRCGNREPVDASGYIFILQRVRRTS